MRHRRPLLHWLLLLALVVMWGSSFLLNKVALAALAPTDLVAGRMVIAAVTLGFVLVVLRRTLPKDGRLWRFFLAMALMGNVLPFWLIAWGQQRIDSSLAGILMAIMPLTTLLLAHFFVAGERLTPWRGAGFLLGFLGIVVLMGPEALLELRGTGTALVSQLAVLGGAMCYAVNAVIARHRPKSDALSATTGVTLVACLFVVPIAALQGPTPLAEITPAAGLAVAALGLVSTAFATILFFKLIAQAGPTFMALINYLIPPWAVAIGMVFLDERPSWSALAALALILSGIALSEAGGRSKR